MLFLSFFQMYAALSNLAVLCSLVALCNPFCGSECRGRKYDRLVVFFARANCSYIHTGNKGEGPP